MSRQQRGTREIEASYVQLKALLPATKRELVERMGLTMNVLSRTVKILQDRKEIYICGGRVQESANRLVAVYDVRTRPDQKDVEFDPRIVPREPDEDDGVHLLDIERERKRLQAKAQRDIDQLLQAGGDPLISLFFGRKTINEVQQGSK